MFLDRSILKLFLYVKKFIILVLFLMIIQSAISIINPLILKYLIDNVIPSQDTELLKKVAFLIVGIFIIEMIVNFIYNVIMPYIVNKINVIFKQKILNHILYLDLDFFSKNQVGKMNNVIQRDTYVVIGFISRKVIPLFSELINLIFIITTLFILDTELTLISLSFIPIYFILYTYAGKQLEKRIPSYYKLHDKLSQFILQSISGIEVIKTFNREENEGENYKTICDEYVKSEIKLNIIESITGVISSVFGKFIVLGIFLYAILLMFDNSITLGVAIAFNTYLIRLLTPVQIFSSLTAESKRSKESYNRIKQYLDLIPKVKDNPNSISKNNLENGIQFHDVSFGYNSDEYNLKNINIDIPKKSSIALVGKSGSGKSTIIKLLLRLYDVNEGEISIDGINIRKIKINDLRNLIGYIGQDNFLFNKSIRENILYGNENISDEKLTEICKKVNIYEFILTLKDGFNTIVGERGVKLSGGEKQRIAIARALIKNPQIIILDEATSHLDSNNENIIQQSIKALSKTTTLVIIAHRLSTIKDVDKIYVLKDNKISEQGSHKELLENKSEYYLLWNEQIKEEIVR